MIIAEFDIRVRAADGGHCKECPDLAALSIFIFNDREQQVACLENVCGVHACLFVIKILLCGWENKNMKEDLARVDELNDRMLRKVGQ